MILEWPTENARKYGIFPNKNKTGEWKPCERSQKENLEKRGKQRETEMSMYKTVSQKPE